MFQRANLLLSASLFALTAAVAFPQTAAPAHKETLHWKFKPGEKLHYQLEAVEQRELRFRDGENSSETQRQTYWYCWSVEGLDGRGGARIRVAFDRIQAQLENPSGSVTVDSAAPLAPAELTPAAAELQNDVYRMARASFVFHASHHGGIPRPLPNVPLAVHMPERFTTGQLPIFVEQPMGVGSEWSAVVADAEPGGLRVGTAVYRVTSAAKLNGTSCLKLDSVTSYEDSQASGAIAESEPGTAVHYFKAESGRLLYSEQSNRFLVLSDPMGRAITDSRLTYRLLALPPEAPSITVDRQLADDETEQFRYENGEPALAEGRWARVVACGGSLDARRQIKAGAEGAPQHRFEFTLRASVDNLKSVSVYDVTARHALLVARSDAVLDDRNEIKLATTAHKLTDPALDWLRRDEVTEWIFKIVLENRAGKTETLYQPILQRTGAIRDYLIEKKVLR